MYGYVDKVLHGVPHPKIGFKNKKKTKKKNHNTLSTHLMNIMNRKLNVIYMIRDREWQASVK
jgi:hypothetical protein